MLTLNATAVNAAAKVVFWTLYFGASYEWEVQELSFFFFLSFLGLLMNFLCFFLSSAGKGTHPRDIITVDQSQHDGQHQSECISSKV